MSYVNLTTENPSRLKRFSHQKRFDIALKLLVIEGNDDILDFGTGDGFMLNKLLSKNPRSIVGYEPIEHQYKQLKEFIDNKNVEITNELDNIEAKRFDKVCCLEVLEHMTENNQRLILAQIKRILKNGGRLVISVPIEIGLSGLLKNIARYYLRQAHPNATVLNIIKSFFRMKVDRGQKAYISSHVGFDYHDLENIITSSGYEIKRKCFSPLTAMRGFLNSQVFYVLELKAKS